MPAWRATPPNARWPAPRFVPAPRALALACAAETDRLITASSRGDASVARAIRDDTEFRALGFVLRTQGTN